MVNTPDETKDTAQSHTPRTPPLSAALGAFTDPSSKAAADEATPPAVDDGGLDLTLKKKKKKKIPKDDDVAGGEGAEDGGLDLTMKKKKKKKVPKEGDEDDFAAKLKALELDGKTEEAAAEEPLEEGDMEAGTGIWAHSETRPLSYTLLLDRFFHELAQRNPDHALSGSKSYKIPPPQCMREGNKKTIFANLAEIAKRMKRTEEHLTQYVMPRMSPK